MYSVQENYLREQDLLIDYLQDRVHTLERELAEAQRVAQSVPEATMEDETGTVPELESQIDYDSVDVDSAAADIAEAPTVEVDDDSFQFDDDTPIELESELDEEPSLVDEPGKDVTPESDDLSIRDVIDPKATSSESVDFGVFSRIEIPEDVTDSRTMVLVALHTPAISSGLRRDDQAEYAMSVFARLVSRLDDLARDHGGNLLDVVNGTILLAIGIDGEPDLFGFSQGIDAVRREFGPELDGFAEDGEAILFAGIHEGPVWLHLLNHENRLQPLLASDAVSIALQILHRAERDKTATLASEAAFDTPPASWNAHGTLGVKQLNQRLALFAANDDAQTGSPSMLDI